jgi:cell wall-associated NlpC family hydrolase
MLMMGMAICAVPALAQDGGSSDPSGGGAAAPSGDGTQSGQTQGSTASNQPADPSPSDPSGGTAYGTSSDQASTNTTPLVDGSLAKILPNGLAAAPSMAPAEVQQAIWAANKIIGRPYVYGGGHTTTFRSKGYDCSGTVSFALHGASLLTAPLDSSSFMRWGAKGQGAWMTIWTNPGHAFLDIAGIRLDTSAAGDPSGKHGPRWRPLARGTKGFHARHPLGL